MRGRRTGKVIMTRPLLALVAELVRLRQEHCSKFKASIDNTEESVSKQSKITTITTEQQS